MPLKPPETCYLLYKTRGSIRLRALRSYAGGAFVPGCDPAGESPIRWQGPIHDAAGGASGATARTIQLQSPPYRK